MESPNLYVTEDRSNVKPQVFTVRGQCPGFNAAGDLLQPAIRVGIRVVSRSRVDGIACWPWLTLPARHPSACSPVLTVRRRPPGTSPPAPVPPYFPAFPP